MTVERRRAGVRLRRRVLRRGRRRSRAAAGGRRRREGLQQRRIHQRPAESSGNRSPNRAAGFGAISFAVGGLA